MAPQVGLEPTTLRLTAGCSAIELLRSGGAAPEGRDLVDIHNITGDGCGDFKVAGSFVISNIWIDKYLYLRQRVGMARFAC